MYLNDSEVSKRVKKRVLEVDKSKMEQLCKHHGVNVALGDLFVEEILRMTDDQLKIKRNYEIKQTAKLLGII